MATEWIRYGNQGATRNRPLSDDLIRATSFLPELGVEMEVFSGGQPTQAEVEAAREQGIELGRVGSTRHDEGSAADVYFYKDGRRLDWANPQDRPIFEQIVQRGRAAGLTGFGAGPGYMRPGSMHIGFGSGHVWGAGGRSENAPEWLVSAYNASPSTGNAGTQAIAAATQPQATNPGLIPQRPANFPSLLPQVPQRVAQTPMPPQRPGMLGGLLNAGQNAMNAVQGVRQGVQQTAQNVGGSLQGNPIARAMLGNQVRGFWSNPNMGTAISRDPIQGRQGVAVQTVGQGGGQMAYATPSMRSGSSRSSINSPAAVIRRSNSAAIREATGSGAISRSSIADALDRGATLVRRR